MSACNYVFSVIGQRVTAGVRRIGLCRLGAFMLLPTSSSRTLASMS